MGLATRGSRGGLSTAESLSAPAGPPAGPGPSSAHLATGRRGRHPTAGSGGVPTRATTRLQASRGEPLPWAFGKWQRMAVEYSDDAGSVSPEQVRDLWEACFGDQLPPEKRDLRRIQRSLQYSFTVQMLFADNFSGSDSPARQKKLIGFARTESDGAFVAVIWDLCVHPDYRGNGYGRELLQRLVRNTRRAGASGFAAFPKPVERLFFFRNDFKWNSKYRIMRYEPECSRPEDSSSAPPTTEEAADN